MLRTSSLKIWKVSPTASDSFINNLFDFFRLCCSWGLFSLMISILLSAVLPLKNIPCSIYSIFVIIYNLDYSCALKWMFYSCLVKRSMYLTNESHWSVSINEFIDTKCQVHHSVWGRFLVFLRDFVVWSKHEGLWSYMDMCYLAFDIKYPMPKMPFDIRGVLLFVNWSLFFSFFFLGVILEVSNVYQTVCNDRYTAKRAR